MKFLVVSTYINVALSLEYHDETEWKCTWEVEFLVSSQGTE